MGRACGVFCGCACLEGDTFFEILPCSAMIFAFARVTGIITRGPSDPELVFDALPEVSLLPGCGESVFPAPGCGAAFCRLGDSKGIVIGNSMGLSLGR